MTHGPQNMRRIQTVAPIVSLLHCVRIHHFVPCLIRCDTPTKNHYCECHSNVPRPHGVVPTIVPNLISPKQRVRHASRKATHPRPTFALDHHVRHVIRVSLRDSSIARTCANFGHAPCPFDQRVWLVVKARYAQHVRYDGHG